MKKRAPVNPLWRKFCKDMRQQGWKLIEHGVFKHSNGIKFYSFNGSQERKDRIGHYEQWMEYVLNGELPPSD